MSNVAYPKGITGLMTGLIDLDTAVLKAAFVRGYTYSASHEFMSDITGAGGGTLNGTSAAIGSVTVVDGVLDGADTSASTTANATDHILILFQASAVTGGADVAASAQRLIARIDTGTGLPIQPGTGSTPITWDNGANKIVKIGP